MYYDFGAFVAVAGVKKKKRLGIWFQIKYGLTPSHIQQNSELELEPICMTDQDLQIPSLIQEWGKIVR